MKLSRPKNLSIPFLFMYIKLKGLDRKLQKRNDNNISILTVFWFANSFTALQNYLLQKFLLICSLKDEEEKEI